MRWSRLIVPGMARLRRSRPAPAVMVTGLSRAAFFFSQFLLGPCDGRAADPGPSRKGESHGLVPVPEPALRAATGHSSAHPVCHVPLPPSSHLGNVTPSRGPRAPLTDASLMHVLLPLPPRGIFDSLPGSLLGRSRPGNNTASMVGSCRPQPWCLCLKARGALTG